MFMLFMGFHLMLPSSVTYSVCRKSNATLQTLLLIVNYFLLFYLTVIGFNSYFKNLEKMLCFREQV